MTRIFLIVTFTIFTTGCAKEEKIVEPKSDKAEVKTEAVKSIDTKQVLKDEVKEIKDVKETKEETKVETKTEIKSAK